MSPIKQKKLDKLRSQLDKLDNSFIKLLQKRTQLVKKVLELKDRKNQIVDKKRIKFILSQIKKKSINHINTIDNTIKTLIRLDVKFGKSPFIKSI